MKNIENAWDQLANTMRLYSEARFRFKSLLLVDKEEAINNLDRTFEAKLEKYHALYDVTNSISRFKYFESGDTSLLIALRNAIHHRNHGLFRSWNAYMHLDGGLERHNGEEFLLVRYHEEADSEASKYFILLDDFYERLTHPKVREPEALKSRWENDLHFSRILEVAKDLGFDKSHVYVDVMPIFISALCRTTRWLTAHGITPTGFDSQTYADFFEGPQGVDLRDISYQRLTIKL